MASRNGPIDGSFRVPGDVDLQTLFHSFRRLLILDRQLKHASLLSFLRDWVCADVAWEVENVPS